MKTHATILFLQAIIGIGILMASSYPRVQDNTRKAYLEAALSFPQTTVQIVAFNDQSIIKQFESEVSSLKQAYWSYLNNEGKAHDGAYAAASVLILSALMHSLIIIIRSKRQKSE